MKLVRDEVELEEVKGLLKKMETDPSLVTISAYRANADLWPDHQITFIDTHLTYLRANPQVNALHYLSNLRLKLRKTPSGASG
ncbi:MAG TPA: hypothetical protein VLG25_03150, partial [Patescibacteria group bacterium]|nr:hypothetical protein [Patescibacteria group bacterium]